MSMKSLLVGLVVLYNAVDSIPQHVICSTMEQLYYDLAYKTYDSYLFFCGRSDKSCFPGYFLTNVDLRKNVRAFQAKINCKDSTKEVDDVEVHCHELFGLYDLPDIVKDFVTKKTHKEVQEKQMKLMKDAVEPLMKSLGC